MNLRIITVAAISFWAVVIWLTLLSALPYNPISLNFSTELSLKLMMPEGWGFFSRNPREQDLLIYKKQNSEWKSVLNPLTSSENWFGFSRDARSLSVEAAMLLDGVDKSNWIQCEDKYFQSCISEKNVSITELTNESPHPVICDTICMILTEPVPWAWSKDMHHSGMPSKILYLKIECKK